MLSDISPLGPTPDLMLVDRKAGQRNLHFLDADHGEIEQGRRALYKAFMVHLWNWNRKSMTQSRLGS